MPAYDGLSFRPPAPVATVIVRSPSTGAVIAGVPMLMDSRADVSLLPRELVARLLDETHEPQQYEIEAFDGTRSLAPVAQLELLLLNKSFRGQFLVVDGRIGILGRNILNAISLRLDGPRLVWEEDR